MRWTHGARRSLMIASAAARERRRCRRKRIVAQKSSRAQSQGLVGQRHAMLRDSHSARWQLAVVHLQRRMSFAAVLARAVQQPPPASRLASRLSTVQMANLPPQLSRALGDAAPSVEQFAEIAPGIPWSPQL